jgi:CheY-like chemotaxis protein
MSESTNGVRRRILVVDDDDDIRMTLAELLRMDGHEVAVASDGLQALDMMRQDQREVVLLDIGLPKMNGYLVAQAMRRESQGRKPVLVAITGWEQDDEDTPHRKGFDYHLVKPFDLDSLHALLSKLPPP